MKCQQIQSLSRILRSAKDPVASNISCYAVIPLYSVYSHNCVYLAGCQKFTKLYSYVSAIYRICTTPLNLELSALAQSFNCGEPGSIGKPCWTFGFHRRSVSASRFTTGWTLLYLACWAGLRWLSGTEPRVTHSGIHLHQKKLSVSASYDSRSGIWTPVLTCHGHRAWRDTNHTIHSRGRYKAGPGLHPL